MSEEQRYLVWDYIASYLSGHGADKPLRGSRSYTLAEAKADLAHHVLRNGYASIRWSEQHEDGSWYAYPEDTTGEPGASGCMFRLEPR
ncbi:hypothetical protein JOF53_000850 [Crossiella equi]|uniref:Uncharacterized protein n=1 Tax=Crossiella equi TaxID=130796 RepID=A0ABS5A5V8_9PSEU|nr:hypothetical protein [Crossiella equi]MBP2471978.1 hypothetical protein [Crossiella equi]